jgi:predicted RNase H-like nuclease (RuvC/YqgF family)
VLERTSDYSRKVVTATSKKKKMPEISISNDLSDGRGVGLAPDQILNAVRFQLLEERKSGKPNKDELNDKISAKEGEIEENQSKIDKAKEQAKNRKREIDHWKQWFHSLPGTDRTEEQAKLDIEINWRGKEINAWQEEIGNLETKKWAIRHELEALKQQLLALEDGVYDRPIEEDPRLIHAIAAFEEAMTTLKETQSVN